MNFGRIHYIVKGLLYRNRHNCFHHKNFLKLNVIANSVDPDQTPRSAASDLVLLYLPMSLLWDDKQKWVKIFFRWEG